MKAMQRTLGRYPLGIWIALAAILLSFIAWLMQAYSLIHWESAVSLGLQNGSFEGDAAGKVLATKERGEAIADLLWPLPLAILAFYGLLKTTFLGFVASMMEYAICIYFPLFYVFQMWETHPGTVLGALFLWAIPSIAGIIGLWSNRKAFEIT